MMDDTVAGTPYTRRRRLLPAMHRVFALCVLVLSPALFRVPAAAKQESIHTVVTTECTPYFDWQVLGLWYRYCPLQSAEPATLACLYLSGPEDVLSAAWVASSSARLMAECTFIRCVKCAVLLQQTSIAHNKL